MNEAANMTFTTKHGVAFKLPEMSGAEAKEGSPAAFIRELRLTNMEIPLGWFAVGVVPVYRHMAKILRQSEKLSKQHETEKLFSTKRVRTKL